MTRRASLSAIACTTLLAALPSMTLAQTAGSEQSGTCILKPREIVHLGSPVSGLLAKIAVDRGDIVKKGQLIAELEANIQRATLALARAKAANDSAVGAEQAEFDMLQRAVNRTKPLAEKQFATMAALDEAQSKLEVSRMRIRSAKMDLAMAALEVERAQQDLDLRLIKSSIDGVVTERKLAPGEYVSEQTPLLILAQVDPLNVELVLPAARFGEIHHAMEMEVRPSQPIGGVYRARVEVVDPVIDAASNTFGVRLVLPNPNNAIPAGVRCDVSWQ